MLFKENYKVGLALHPDSVPWLFPSGNNNWYASVSLLNRIMHTLITSRHRNDCLLNKGNLKMMTAIIYNYWLFYLVECQNSFEWCVAEKESICWERNAIVASKVHITEHMLIVLEFEKNPLHPICTTNCLTFSSVFYFTIKCHHLLMAGGLSSYKK